MEPSDQMLLDKARMTVERAEQEDALNDVAWRLALTIQAMDECYFGWTGIRRELRHALIVLTSHGEIR